MVRNYHVIIYESSFPIIVKLPHGHNLYSNNLWNNMPFLPYETNLFLDTFIYGHPLIYVTKTHIRSLLVTDHVFTAFL